MIPGEFARIEGPPPHWWLRLKSWFGAKNDPVKHCEVYRNKAEGSCAHVDGPLCDYPSCSILKKYREEQQE